MSKQGIYSGLTNEQAFAIMNSMLEVRELHALESGWNPNTFWVRSLLTWAVLAIGCIAGCAAAALGLGTTLVVSMAVSVVVWGIAHVVYASALKRIAYLRALKIGLEQFKLAAENSPGATAAALLEVMPA